MATITEDYVSFETAKLLKEKGFDEGCHFVVSTISKGMLPVSWPTTNSDIEDEKASLIALPTQQMAMRWLREVYKILILVEYDCPVFSSDIYKMDDIDEYGSAKHISPTFANCKNYEEACESAIKYSLENLI